MKNKSTYIDRCRELIDQVGYRELAQELSISPQVICNWKTRGIPRGWSCYLKTVYKNEWKKSGLSEYSDKKD